jgi:RNA polymerase sigma-70 factor, ECF subfamily
MSAAPTFRESSATAEAAQAGLLYERYASRLMAFCRSRLGSREEAEDAVQQTFLNAHRSLRSGTVPHAEAAWMFAIAANVCRERHRSAWRRSRVEVVSDDGLVGEQAAPEQSHDELAGVADALAALTPNQRRAILMREWQGLSYREIAGELALTEGAVETLIFRARRSLASKLDRSRGRIWGISNLGPAFAWGKAVLGGTAAQVAAATLVVGASVGGVVAVMPRHASTPPAAVPVRSVSATPVHRAAAPNHVAAVTRTRPRSTPSAVVSGHVPGTDPGTRPESPVRSPVTEPVAAEQPAPPPVTPAVPPVTAPPPPAAPPVPKVEVPPLPPVPPLPTVEVPPLPPPPPLPQVEVPSLPLPDLPKLP